MNSRALILTLNALFVSLALGQTAPQPGPIRVFHLSQSESQQDINELTAAVDTIANLKIAPDIELGTVTLRGTADQVALAAWLLEQLDQPAPSSHQPATYDYQTDKRAPAVRVFRMANIETPHGLSEITATIRTISDVSRAVPYVSQRALAMRGTADQAALIEWLLNQLDQPASPVHDSAAYDYQADARDSAVRVFRLAHVETKPDLQEITNVMRTMADVTRVLPDLPRGALVMRGTADQMALAEWLVDELDLPAGGDPAAQAQDPADHEFQVPDSDQMVHVFHFASSTTAQQFVDIAAQARLAAKVDRTYICFSQRALPVRGTLDQIAATQQLVREMMKP
jgi:hypothetical protein